MEQRCDRALLMPPQAIDTPTTLKFVVHSNPLLSLSERKGGKIKDSKNETQLWQWI